MRIEGESQPLVRLLPAFTPSTPRPPDEAERLAALRTYELLDTPADPRIDVFVRVAAQFYDVPLSMVSLVDAERVWFKAATGRGMPEVSRESAFCAHAIVQSDNVMVVEDARDDARFAHTPLVAGKHGFRFYAGAPITTPEGHALGTLCILDQKARTLDQGERQRLADLATGVGAVLDLHRHAVRLRQAATQDSLTGLANRTLFEPVLAKAVAAATPDAPVAVICLDLDHFKQVNDRFGHAGGDTLLRVAANRLRASVRPTDLSVRLGGDELAVLLRGPFHASTPHQVAERIIAAFAEPVWIDGVPVPVRVSAGYASAPADARDGPGLMRVADAALYAAKSSGRGTLAGPDATYPVPSSLLGDLRLALADGTFSLNWQPYTDLATGHVHGHEALVRWNRPDHGPVSAATFVSMAEENGLAKQLDSWVLRNACQEAARHALPEISVNVTPASFHTLGFARQVASALSLAGLPGQRLVLEVSQRAVSDDLARTRHVVDELAAIGVTVALHNFGDGDSALTCLREVPFGRIKLGHAFVERIGQDHRTDALIRSIVQMGIALGSTVCAEGLETPSQLAFVRDAGCKLGQGFLLAPPAPVPV